jgi:hypothetical protein
MTTLQKSKLVKTNTILWLTAIGVPVVLHFALASSKFPWPVILPFLLLGPMLASNNMLTKAIGDTTDDAT